MSASDIDQLCIDTIRTLSMDAVQKANSGHPGLPMGIASEAASLAGHLGLGRLVYLYDDNHISLDGPTSLSFETEDPEKRFEAYGWDVRSVLDANDVVALEAAIRAGQEEEERPTLIRVK